MCTNNLKDMERLMIVLMVCVLAFTEPLMAKASDSPVLSLEVLNTYIEDSPNDPNLYFVKGQLLLDMGKFRKAQKSFETVLDMYPNYYDANLELAKIFLRSAKYTSASTHIEKYLEKRPDDSSAKLINASIQLGMREFNLAKSIANKVLEVEPKNGKAYLVRGEANYELGEIDKAAQDWDTATELGETEAGIIKNQLIERIQVF